MIVSLVCDEAATSPKFKFVEEAVKYQYVSNW